jgi:glycosyltransferase involved in cell wall biosynthesis
VPSGDAAALADALIEAFRDPEGLRARGVAARAHVRERYGAGRLVRDIDALYTELLSGRGAGSRSDGHPVATSSARRRPR